MKKFYANVSIRAKSVFTHLFTTYAKIASLMIFALIMNNQSLTSQTITTDKVDYLPGDNVVATGNGWEPYEVVTLSMEEQALTFEAVPLVKEKVTCDAEGNFQEVIYVVEEADLGAFFHLKARGSEGHVTTITFNDAGGDYAIDFSAYDPEYYDRVCYADGSISTPIMGNLPASPLNSTDHNNTVESLMPEHLGLGQIVAFEYYVRADASGACSNDMIRIDGEFLTVTTNGGAFGFDGNLGVIAAFVDASGSSVTDNGALASVNNFTWSLNGDKIESSVYITGLDPGDEITIEVWLVLQETIAQSVGGNVKSRLGDSEAIGACEPGKINTGNQEIPLLQVGDFFDANVDLSVDKTDTVDPVSLDDQFTYTITVHNEGPAVANEVVLTDLPDPNTTYLSYSVDPLEEIAWSGGLQGDGSLVLSTGFLNPGVTSVIEVTVSVNNDGSTPTSSTGGSGPCTGIEDLCNTVSITSLSQDIDLTNNQADEPTGVSCPDINLTSVQTDETCFEYDDGSIAAVIEGGTPIYTAEITGANLPDDYTTTLSVTDMSGSFLFENLPAGIYSITVTDMYGCQGTIGDLLISQPDQLAANISGNPSLCYGENADLSVTTTGGTPDYVYNWYDAADPLTSLGTNDNLTLTPETSCVYMCDVTDANMCTTSRDFSLTVNSNPECSISGQDLVCPNTSATFSGPSGELGFEWSIVGDGIITSAIDAQTVTVLSSSTCNGQYTLSLTVTSVDGCSDISDKTVFISDPNPPVLEPAPADITVACASDIPAMLDIAWTDDCDISGSVTGYDLPASIECEGQITRIWKYTDGCNHSDSVTQLITIDYEDFLMPDDMSSTVACHADAVMPDAPVVYDNCGELLTAVPGEVGGTYDGCEGTVTYPFTYTDCAGNSHTWTYTYTVIYEDFVLPEDAGSTVACYADADSPPVPEVYDNCGVLLSPIGNKIGGTYNGCEGTVIYPLTYTDCAGNTHTWT
ncbi:MAG: hypothetical protein ACQES0_11350, partial [Bacteroidota bacterium]